MLEQNVPRGERSGDEPMPVVHEDQPCIQDMVIESIRQTRGDEVGRLVCADIEERKALGIARYGTTLQPFNGRRAYVDAYQELLDLVNYTYQEMYEARERSDNVRFVRWRRYLQIVINLAVQYKQEQ